METEQQPHNPDNLTPEQIGVAEDWRLLNKNEIGGPISRGVEYWLASACSWDDSCSGGRYLDTTYRTRLTPAELRRARGLEPDAATASPIPAKSEEKEGPTPETDAAIIKVDGSPYLYSGRCWIVDVDFARSLERQRNAARAELESLRRERDEAVRAVARQRHGVSGLCCQLRLQEKERADAATSELSRLKEELAEAREKWNAEYKSHSDTTDKLKSMQRKHDDLRSQAEGLAEGVGKYISDRAAHRRDDHSCELCAAYTTYRQANPKEGGE